MPRQRRRTGRGSRGRGVVKNVSATRVVASTVGALVGLAGIEHGIFEILQGNVATGGFMIDAIGPAQKLWAYGGEAAVTIVPNFLVTGILAVIVGLGVTVWAAAFVHRQRGGLVLLLLSALLFVVGGGFAPPIFLGIPAGLTATRIGKPLRFWRRVLRGGTSRFLSKTWLGILIAFVLCFVISVEIIIFGWPLTAFLDAEAALGALTGFAFGYLGLMLLSIVAAFTHDVEQRADRGNSYG
jgi:hypothetical protein